MKPLAINPSVLAPQHHANVQLIGARTVRRNLPYPSSQRRPVLRLTRPIRGNADLLQVSDFETLPWSRSYWSSIYGTATLRTRLAPFLSGSAETAVLPSRLIAIMHIPRHAHQLEPHRQIAHHFGKFDSGTLFRMKLSVAWFKRIISYDFDRNPTLPSEPDYRRFFKPFVRTGRCD